MNNKGLEAYLARLDEKINPDIGEEIKAQKKQAVPIGDENKANYLWCLYQIFLVQKNYTYVFWNMKNKRYEDVWLQLDRADIELLFLDKHYEKYLNEPIGFRF